jgi:uncharacterized protein YegP (UPF0339 family)
MYFTIERASGGYRGHAYGGNHQLVWWTEVYVNKGDVYTAIAMLQAHAANARILDRA